VLKKFLDTLKARRVYTGWKRPAKFDRNLVVIGAGAGGLVSAYIAAAVKAKVTLVERHRMGGDCLYTGCVPSKALIRTAKFLSQSKRSAEFGVRAATAEFERVHGRVPGGELLIVGYGRLGGGVLTHASDLDVVFLFTGDHAAESDGGRPLGATLYFNRLAQRVIVALSVPTAEGALYEVDTRLRPSGAQGPISVSLEAFERYQRESAWTWEHMALARARVLYGSDGARTELDGIIRGVLELARDPAKLRTEVLEMRTTMAQHKPAKGPLDVKLARGGLVDAEFIVHSLQLRDHVAL
jgi:glutamate-ammonia-ligase adenylyltransferase